MHTARESFLRWLSQKTLFIMINCRHDGLNTIINQIWNAAAELSAAANYNKFYTSAFMSLNYVFVAQI